MFLLSQCYFTLLLLYKKIIFVYINLTNFYGFNAIFLRAYNTISHFVKRFILVFYISFHFFHFQFFCEIFFCGYFCVAPLLLFVVWS